MSRTQRPYKFYIPSIDFIENEEAVAVERLNDLMKLREGQRIRVAVNGKLRERKIEKVYKHFVLTKNPKSGYNECFTKGEIFIYNYKKGRKGYERCFK